MRFPLSCRLLPRRVRLSLRRDRVEPGDGPEKLRFQLKGQRENFLAVLCLALALSPVTNSGIPTYLHKA